MFSKLQTNLKVFLGGEVLCLNKKFKHIEMEEFTLEWVEFISKHAQKIIVNRILAYTQPFKLYIAQLALNILPLATHQK
jgi:hypothetical protein